jgi:hypothetical protein
VRPSSNLELPGTLKEHGGGRSPSDLLALTNSEGETSIMLRWFALLVPLLMARSKRELRGHSAVSEDGQTYLVVAEAPGCATLLVDGKRWPHKFGARGIVRRGVRRIACPNDSSALVQVRRCAGA